MGYAEAWVKRGYRRRALLGLGPSCVRPHAPGWIRPGLACRCRMRPHAPTVGYCYFFFNDWYLPFLALFLSPFSCYFLHALKAKPHWHMAFAAVFFALVFK